MLMIRVKEKPTNKIPGIDIIIHLKCRSGNQFDIETYCYYGPLKTFVLLAPQTFNTLGLYSISI